LALVDFLVLLVAVFFSAILNDLLDPVPVADAPQPSQVAEVLLGSGSAGHARHRSVATGEA
jgi:hypothetical protein